MGGRHAAPRSASQPRCRQPRCSMLSVALVTGRRRGRRLELAVNGCAPLPSFVLRTSKTLRWPHAGPGTRLEAFSSSPLLTILQPRRSDKALGRRAERWPSPAVPQPCRADSGCGNLAQRPEPDRECKEPVAPSFECPCPIPHPSLALNPSRSRPPCALLLRYSPVPSRPPSSALILKPLNLRWLFQNAD